MENLPSTPKSNLTPIAIGALAFILGAGIGAGGFYFYSQRVLIPKYKTQMMNEMLSGQGTDWGDFFKKVETEKSSDNPVNPFEGVGETAPENYVNPFDLIE